MNTNGRGKHGLCPSLLCSNHHAPYSVSAQGHKCSEFLLSGPSTLADVPWEVGAPFISFSANQICPIPAGPSVASVHHTLLLKN